MTQSSAAVKDILSLKLYTRVARLGSFSAAARECGLSQSQASRMGLADMVAFGRPYIANPDLVERIASGAPLAEFDWETVYAAGPRGYSDYPKLVPVPGRNFHRQEDSSVSGLPMFGERFPE